MSGKRVQEFLSTRRFESWLEENSRLPEMNRRSLTAALPTLCQRIDKDRKSSIGIAGPPGSGKSTLARALAHKLQLAGIPACLLSLDDYYLGKSRRKQLANDVHPCLQQRGIPGTHDLDRLLSDYDRLWRGHDERVRLPVFDKSADDAAPESRWREVNGNPQVLLVEGWCIGAPPGAITFPGSSETWHDHVQNAWQKLYGELHRRLQQVWYIRVPDWPCVIDWRWQQERELAQPRLADRADVERFLASFQGICSYMRDSHSGWADLVLPVTRDHNFQQPESTRTKQ